VVVQSEEDISDSKVLRHVAMATHVATATKFSSINTFKRSINSVDFSRFLLRNFNGHFVYFVLVVFMFYCFNTFVSVFRAVVSAVA